jgi:general transcription factor 3C polypeptide 3 (transcription factor C subunit 4)
MIAAHLTPKDIALWRRLAQLSSEQGLTPQAIYCYTQVRRGGGGAAGGGDAG